MSVLTDYEFKSEYQKLEDDIAEEFYLPCMRSSITYDRISGYFGSTVYIIAWSALKEFISNGGRMRIICSPYLSADDAEAIKTGNEAKKDAVLLNTVKTELDSLLEDDYLSASARLLSCLIANGSLQIKIAIAGDGVINPTIERLYHDKAGIFTDINGNSVGFRGSFNETFKGLSNNGNIESADVFQSWDIGKDVTRVKNIRTAFDKIWNGDYEVLQMYDLPKEAQQYIRNVASKYNWEELLDEVKVTVDKAEKWRPNKKKEIIRLKEHQSEALDSWEKQGFKGIYQGCTGCGKTVIAISAIRHQLDQGKVVIVLVPSKELLTNWESEIKRILSDVEIHIFLCGDGNTSWRKNNNLALWTEQSAIVKKVVIAMMDTASKPEFINSISDGEHLFVVADEVHRTGSPTRRKFFSVKYGTAFGLSATPIRYGDPEGTQAIIDYFGPILQPPYTLKNALDDKVLTPYFYYPQTVTLTPEEQEKWDNITQKISKRAAITQGKPNTTISDDSLMQQMCIERARIIKKAKGKLHKAVEILKSAYKDGQKWLVYCEDIEQLEEVKNAIRKEGIDAYSYYAGMPGNREKTLDYFAENGGVLVSIKCLDEGVDIPSTTHALILASSKNPREFIQRRGRILRRAANKNFSHLYDVIAVPNEITALQDKSLKIITSELARAIEFGGHAENKSCITDLKLISVKFGMDYMKFINEGYADDDE